MTQLKEELKEEKLYSRKEMLQMTGKSLAGIAMVGTLPTILSGCGNEEANDGESASAVADTDVVYTPDDEDVCSKEIRYSVKDGQITGVEVDGGCDGNLKGVSALIEGMTPEEAIKRLDGITCSTGGVERNSSCPDQIARSLKELL